MQSYSGERAHLDQAFAILGSNSEEVRVRVRVRVRRKIAQGSASSGAL